MKPRASLISVQCHTRIAETFLEIDDHDGGSVLCCPGEWAYIETENMNEFFVFCPKCVKAAEAKSRKLYGLGEPS